tara:strand:+ start:1678 stop:2070 length:393 start_codon:yes stop_codon:yes gene_type:complete
MTRSPRYSTPYLQEQIVIDKNMIIPPERPCLITFTSGTTDKPKGAAIPPHRFYADLPSDTTLYTWRAGRYNGLAELLEPFSKSYGVERSISQDMLLLRLPRFGEISRKAISRTSVFLRQASEKCKIITST